jgi:hypothetical protein
VMDRWLIIMIIGSYRMHTPALTNYFIHSPLSQYTGFYFSRPLCWFAGYLLQDYSASSEQYFLDVLSQLYLGRQQRQ